MVAEYLRARGFEVETGVGGHGVVALLRGKKAGPVVAFRADMDAVAFEAPDPVPFASVVPGVRHVCGHDVHTAVGLALARGLAAVRDDLPGTVKLIFQPAEENAQGARAMIAAGVLDNPRPAAILSLHTAPWPVGQIVGVAGPALPGRDLVTVLLSGEGDLDAAAAAVGRLISGLNTVARERLTSLVTEDYLFVQIDPSAAQPKTGRVVTGYVTTASAAMRARAEQEIRGQAAKLGLDGVSVEVDYRRKVIAGVDNDPALEAKLRPALRSAVGEGNLLALQGSIPLFSEDFGSFQERVAGVMYWLGVSNPEKGTTGMPHSPSYVADEEAIFVGARAMAAGIVHLLQSP